MLRRATAEDIRHVAANMRQTDRDEIEAMTGLSAAEAVASIDLTPNVAFALGRDAPAVIFGAMLLDGNVASMFRFATDEWPLVVREAIKFGRRVFLPRLWVLDIARVEAVTLDDPEQTAWLRLFGATEGTKFSRNGRVFANFSLDRPRDLPADLS